MKIITTVFGEKYLGMLLTLLYSINKTNPALECEVYYQDFPMKFISSLESTFPNVSFYKTNFNFSSDRLQRIASKTLMWEYAVHNQIENELIILVDVDTLVVQKLELDFQASDDILFTTKDEKYPVNTGVIAAKVSNKVKKIFTEWRTQTQAISMDALLSKEANSNLHPYGAADQMSFFRLMSYNKEQKIYNLTRDEESIRFRSIPCAIFNETNSLPITRDVQIIHYKAGWQRVLIDGFVFNENNRPRRDSMEMYRLYLQYFKSALTDLNLITEEKYTSSDLHIYTPQWINCRNVLLQEFLYFSLRLKTYAKKRYLKLKRRQTLTNEIKRSLA